jgi:hypothetical protein
MMEIRINSRVVAVVTEEEREPKFFAKWLKRAAKVEECLRQPDKELRAAINRLSVPNYRMHLGWLALQVMATRAARYKNRMWIQKGQMRHLKVLEKIGFFIRKGDKLTLAMPAKIDESVVRAAVLSVAGKLR